MIIDMSQNYVIFNDPKDLNSPPTAVITNRIIEKSDLDDGMLIISAGTVTFRPGISGVVADVTHGHTVLGVQVDLNQIEPDKKLLEKLFL
jgi:hypothetical protein